ncbi:protein of unknown function [Caballeronia sp. S22]
MCATQAKRVAVITSTTTTAARCLFGACPALSVTRSALIDIIAEVLTSRAEWLSILIANVLRCAHNRSAFPFDRRTVFPNNHGQRPFTSCTPTRAA